MPVCAYGIFNRTIARPKNSRPSGKSAGEGRKGSANAMRAPALKRRPLPRQIRIPRQRSIRGMLPIKGLSRWRWCLLVIESGGVFVELADYARSKPLGAFEGLNHVACRQAVLRAIKKLEGFRIVEAATDFKRGLPVTKVRRLYSRAEIEEVMAELRNEPPDE